MARTKEVEIYGQKFVIASLTLDQVEQLFPATKEEQDKLKENPLGQAERVYQCISFSLSTARPDDPWDKARIKRELDMVTFGELHLAILRLSGLAPEEGAGEPRATPSIH